MRFTFGNVAWIVTTIVAIAIAWGTLDQRVKGLERGQDQLENRVMTELRYLRDEIKSLNESLRNGRRPYDLQ